MKHRSAPQTRGTRQRKDGRQALTESARRSRDRKVTRTVLSRSNITTAALVVIAACLSWPYIRPWISGASRSVERWTTSPPAGAPQRPASSDPPPEEQVKLEAEWRAALEKPFKDLKAYADRLELDEQDGIERQAWFRINSVGNSRAYQAGFRSEYDRLYSDLSGGHRTFHLYGSFDAYAIKKLEEHLQLLQAKLQTACEYLDRGHALTMEEKRKLK